MKLPPLPPKINIPVAQRMLEKYGTDITLCPQCKRGRLVLVKVVYPKPYSARQYCRPVLMQQPRYATRHHHKTTGITKMDVEKLTGKQPFHQRPLMGKGSYAPGTKQSYKAVAAFMAMPFLHTLQGYPWLLIAYTKRSSGTLLASVNKQ